MPRATRNLISVVMPVWRPRPEWLLAAVRSVLAQRDCELELIVVDDGNPQAVAPLLAEVSDRRLRLIRIEHEGQAAARNAGVAAAQGERIRHMDCDDILPLESTARLASLMGDEEVIAYGATLFCDQDLRPTELLTTDVQGNASRACLLARFTVRCPAMLFPRRVVELSGEWDDTFPVSADWQYVLRALDHAPVRGVQEVTLHYRRHATSVSKNAAISDGETAWRRIIEGYFERHPEQRGTRLHRQALAALYLDRGIAYGSIGRYRECLERLARASFLDPATALPSASFVARHPARLLKRWFRRFRPQPMVH